MFGKKKRCTATAEGVVTNLRKNGSDFPTIVTVCYQVNGTSYELRESLKLKSEAIRIGFLPIGQRKTPILKNVQSGLHVTVLYDPKHPSTAYLRDNGEGVNC